MPVLIQQNTESTVSAGNTGASVNYGVGNKAPSPVFCTPLSVRKNKILEIRQQIIEGRYDIDKRMNFALDRLLEDLIAMDRIDYLSPNAGP